MTSCASDFMLAVFYDGPQQRRMHTAIIPFNKFNTSGQGTCVEFDIYIHRAKEVRLVERNVKETSLWKLPALWNLESGLKGIWQHIYVTTAEDVRTMALELHVKYYAYSDRGLAVALDNIAVEMYPCSSHCE